jgi:hypothetical protein
MTTPEPMTVQDVTRLLHAAVEAYGPDWVDPNSANLRGSCKNTYKFKGVTRHCLAGWVLINHGYRITDTLGPLIDVRSDLIRKHRHAVMTDDAFVLLQEAQGMQDNGIAWGEVVTRALHTHKNPAKSEETNTDL